MSSGEHAVDQKAAKSNAAEVGQAAVSRTASSLTPEMSLLALQRVAGNRAVEDTLHLGVGHPPRDPAPGTKQVQRQGHTTTTVPTSVAIGLSRISNYQNYFVRMMREASDIITWTRDYYRFVNGVYKGCYDIHRVVVGQAAEAEEKDKVYAEIVSGLALSAATFLFPEVVAGITALKEAIVLKPVIKLLPETLQPVLEGVVGAGKEAIAQAIKAAETDASGPSPEQIELVTLHVIVELFQMKDGLDNTGMAFFSDALAAMNHFVELGASKSSSPQQATDISHAVTNITERADYLVTGLDDPMTKLRALRDRLWKVVPSWQRCEQDIWIAYFHARKKEWGGEVMRKHMVDLGLAGPPRQAGGRLGVPVDINDALSSTYPYVTTPGHEDAEHQMTVAPKLVGLDEVIAEAAEKDVKPYWRKVLLLSADAPGK